MSKKQREAKLIAGLVRINQDFDKMLRLLGGVTGSGLLASQAYLQRQIGKYLKPLGIGEFIEKTLTLRVALQSPPLLNADADIGARPGKRPNWLTEGDGGEHVSWKLQAGGGWAQFERYGGTKIRINQKAFWLFPDVTLRGVMVHEATHFALATDDIYYSTFHTNNTLKNLENGSENADNWRIFYQKMSGHLASGTTID